MAQKLEIYRCDKCKLIVQVLSPGTCLPECCGDTMELVKENSTDAAKEKHVPVIEKEPDGYKISVGSTLHPMGDDHWIQWIELIADDCGYLYHLKSKDEPVVSFKTNAKRFQQELIATFMDYGEVSFKQLYSSRLY